MIEIGTEGEIPETEGATVRSTCVRLSGNLAIMDDASEEVAGNEKIIVSANAKRKKTAATTFNPQKRQLVRCTVSEAAAGRPW